eukprot:TRINITY_DN67_c0_g1_i1.p1 TRINITY_DN67_c0_g1~~TRINITY_DN67_c0_g1_i1.p1  ORF type:complete len:640 (+),score=149.92 TRINITY_DN67_c0_g1_i1:218-2137(+)
MKVDDDLVGGIELEPQDSHQPEGQVGHTLDLDSPHCGSSLLNNGEMGWQDQEDTDRYRPQNLDSFYFRIYEYCRERGWQCIVMNRVLNLLALCFMIGFTGFLTLMVNWNVVLACDSEATCKHDIINTQPFKKRWVVGFHDEKPVSVGPGIFTVFMVFFLSACCVFLLHNLLRCLYDLKEFWIIKKFMNDRLQITEEEMATVEWNEVIDGMVRLQEEGVLITRNKITPLDVTNRIMRKENFLIAMINKGVVSLDFPLCKGWMPPFFTKTMEWCLNYCITGHMFDPHTFKVKQRFIAHPDTLARNFFMCGVATLVLSPFIALFVMLYSFFKYGQEMHKNPGSLGTRHWSPLARWKFREFNELDHFFEKRLNASYPKANKYVQQFPSMFVSIIAKFVVFVGSAICGVIIVLSLMDEAVLLYVKIADRNLLWYLAICGLVVASARPLVIDSHSNFEPDKAFTSLVEDTHYFPSKWRFKLHSHKTYEAFSVLFPFKVSSFFYEVLSIFIVPLMLMFYLPKQASSITKFVGDFTETRPELGDVCSFAVFDFERHGNAKYGAHIPHDKYYRSKQGKMEKSFITFLENNPNWTPSDDGMLLVKKVQERQQVLTASMASLTSDKFAEESQSSMHSSMDDLAASFTNEV